MTRPDPFAGILLTFGVAVVMRNLMVEVYGADPRHLQAGHLAQASDGIRRSATLGVLPLLILALSVALFTATPARPHAWTRFGPDRARHRAIIVTSCA